MALERRFTDELWDAVRDIYGKTLTHPFLTGLQDGTLARSKFQFYLLQDSLYLGAFGKALRVLADKAPDKQWAADLRRDAAEALDVEKAMHGQILASFGVSAAQARGVAMAPVNYAYTNHLLLACSQGSFLEGLSAMLPCYWIYWEVGKHLAKRGSKDAAYQRWISQYAGPEYGKTVERVLGVTNRVAQGAPAAARERAKDLFVLSARYEYQFWDMGWREERWIP
jgi:thiaminase (transcriptional activator TenA)